MADTNSTREGLAGKSVRLLVGDGEPPLVAGMDLLLSVLRSAPKRGLRKMEGLVSEPVSPTPSGLGGRYVFVMPRYEGDSVADLVNGVHLTVNILVYSHDEVLLGRGTGTLRLAGTDPKQE